jgi:hypothetical protein
VEYLCLALDSRTWHVGIVEEDGRAEDEDDVVAREPCGELLLGRGRCPWKSGWPWEKLASGEIGSCQTGAASFSASVTASWKAPDRSTPAPVTTAGFALPRGCQRTA